ncbi:MAG: Stp1/IreP family PP2C-type Ser/Thr phosphatase [Burkholderiaceae bacterium]|jgi:protein phosphatase|nr:Stp1/IreP family PP2C-type Ser/Thr phosphatase [Burkholderiaceae bacterium]
MDFEYSALTDVGLVRSNNEDAVRVDAQHGIAVLADGMGGYNAGEVASAMAVERVGAQLAQWLQDTLGGTVTPGDLRRAMEICVDNANRAIFDAAHANRAYAGMGTTLVVAVPLGTTLLLLGHVGDSRAYRWRAGALVQLTRDHSVLQEQIAAGLMTPEDAAESTYGNLVTRALGVEDTVQLEVQEVPVDAGDIFLLCSDGLTDMVADEEIAAALGSPEPLQALSQRLVDMAKEGGGRDNVSVALIRVPGASKKLGVMGKLLGK